MKVYRGERLPALPPVSSGVVAITAVHVTVNRRPLNARFDLREHSLTGFEWGYEGSGPAQLALAILADHLNDDDKACELYQEFKRQVIANLPRKGWSLTSQQIEATLKSMQAQTITERR